MSPALQTHGIILAKLPPTEKHTPLTLFTPEHGILRIHQRLSAKTTQTHIDLFDELQLRLQTPAADTTHPETQVWFIQDQPVILRRHDALGHRYETLLHASQLATLIARNPPHAENRSALYENLRATLAALATSSRPDIIHLKALYRLARDEGYPVKQHWHPNLSAPHRQAAAEILNTPADQQNPVPETVAQLHAALLHYLRHHTEILTE